MYVCMCVCLFICLCVCWDVRLCVSVFLKSSLASIAIEFSLCGFGVVVFLGVFLFLMCMW